MSDGIRQHGLFVGMPQARHAAADVEALFRLLFTVIETRRADPAATPEPCFTL
jgi:hypothetical protein